MTQNTIEAILNNLSGTAIYVIRQDNHRILYFNDRVKEVTPDARIGSVCHELWNGTCANCPLPGLKTKSRTALSIITTLLVRWWTFLLQK